MYKQSHKFRLKHSLKSEQEEPKCHGVLFQNPFSQTAGRFYSF